MAFENTFMDFRRNMRNYIISLFFLAALIPEFVCPVFSTEMKYSMYHDQYGNTNWQGADYYNHAFTAALGADVNLINWAAECEAYGDRIAFETAGGVVWCYYSGGTNLSNYSVANQLTAYEGTPPNGWNAWGSKMWFSHYYSGGTLSEKYYFESSAPYPFSFARIDTYYPDPPYTGVNVYPDSVVLTVHENGAPPPDTNYYCYFDLEGVVNWDGQSNKFFTASLLIGQYPDLAVVEEYNQYYDGAYLKSYGPFLIGVGSGGSYVFINVDFCWAVQIDEGDLWWSEVYRTQGSANPNYYHYVVEHDVLSLNPEIPTNVPYFPEIPTNMPPQYPEYPGPWDTNTYGPCPPYYSPWPPPYPAPPPLTEWPAYPPPNWPYNTNSPYSPDAPPSPTPDPNNPTNYQGPGATNGTYTLAQWYDAFRDGLRDSGNEVDFAVPAQYQVVWSNTIGPALEVANQFVGVGNQTITNIYTVVLNAAGKISELTIALPTYFEPQSEIDLGEMPYFGPVVINLTLFSTPINLFRNICKYGLFLTSVLLAMHMIRKALSRGGD